MARDILPPKEDSSPRLAGKANLPKQRSGAFLGESNDEASKFGGQVPDFSLFPEFLRVGPWSVSAYATLGLLTLWLLACAGTAWESHKATLALEMEAPTSLRLAQLVLAAYAIFVNVHAYQKAGWYPFASYTMAGYVLLTLRFALGGLGATWLSEPLRLPALTMALVTTSVWWLVLVPIFLVMFPAGSGKRKKFMEFNFTFFLVNVHLLNTPLALFDHWSTARPLVFADLWLAVLLAFLYCLFYLLVLDARGFHFYIILSPRPWWCCFVYAAIIGIYVAVYTAWK